MTNLQIEYFSQTYRIYVSCIEGDLQTYFFAIKFKGQGHKGQLRSNRERYWLLRVVYSGIDILVVLTTKFGFGVPFDDQK